jgi:energy-coupling factor transporter ATP-binding protein EcfA2
MRQLNIKDFSCIKSAEIKFNRLTVLIGPQASGKSVICKLSYFFIEMISMQNEFIATGRSFILYKEFVNKKFSEWFPPSAWGDKKFSIEFVAGSYKVTLNRITYAKKVSLDYRLKFSQEFQNDYEAMVALVSKQQAKVKDAHAYDFEREYEMRQVVRKYASALMGKDFVDHQFFIPAGRSFFTSIGKAVAAFEQGRVLDPLIIRFGRLFASYKDFGRSRRYFREDSKEWGIDERFAKLLGGKLIVSGEEESVLCPDGRLIPLSTLSSGQQELLPLVTVLPNVIDRGAKQSIYIEEPEAHLFPSSQSELIEIFTTFLSRAGAGTDLIMTTHSPYVLVKVNNLIKAGQLGRSNSQLKRRLVTEIVDRHAWLGANAVSAYAIKDGVVESIVDKDGLIDADYLDGVSGELSREFMRLLEAEVA